jgi:hypothetical protein
VLLGVIILILAVAASVVGVFPRGLFNLSLAKLLGILFKPIILVFKLLGNRPCFLSHFA